MVLRTREAAYIDKRQTQYKGDHENGVRYRKTSTVGGEISIKGHLSTAVTLAENVADMPPSKLHPRSLGTFPMEDFTDTTVVVEFPHGREHVPIGRVVKVPGRPSVFPGVPSLSSPPFSDGDSIVDFARAVTGRLVTFSGAMGGHLHGSNSPNSHLVKSLTLTNAPECDSPCPISGRHAIIRRCSPFTVENWTHLTLQTNL